MLGKGLLMRLLQWLAVVVIVVMFSTVVLQVAGRYLMAEAPPWTEEVGRYLMVWLAALGAGIYFCREDGYRSAVDFIADALPSSWKRVINLVFMAVIAVFLAVLAVKTFELVGRNMDVRTPALSLPMGYVYLAIVVLAVLMLWGLAQHAYREIRGFGRSAPMTDAQASVSRDDDRGTGRA